MTRRKMNKTENAEQLTSHKEHPRLLTEDAPLVDMNIHEYMDYLETRFLELAEESGVTYKKVEPGQGKVIIKENGVILGELGELGDIYDLNDFSDFPNGGKLDE
ncbi:hypothetical protein JMA_38050 (plasmid) [Jeotgalibacillus malaysiensis]|uniref:Uncharacterized protein n=1 Tax=Jeotgalibacillus malaysiensis TaxID=1508404 RepID=A0A0B5AX19_9BACL|nr:hypothetical protein [Jeotgalibacillus malaysiensis]AJD93123.1 hypothetical protein JMA_38050 [Jeotgalibacillus malaysiensis]